MYKAPMWIFFLNVFAVELDPNPFINFYLECIMLKLNIKYLTNELNIARATAYSIIDILIIDKIINKGTKMGRSMFYGCI